MPVTVKLLVQFLVSRGVVAVGGAGDVNRRLHSQVAQIERPIRSGKRLGGSPSASTSPRAGFELRKQRLDVSYRFGRPGFENSLLSKPPDVGQANPISAQKSRPRVRQYLPDAQLTGQSAGVLSSGTAKRHQNVIARVVSPGHRNLANRPHHIGIGDLHEPFGQLDGRILRPGGAHNFVREPIQMNFYGGPISANGNRPGTILPRNKLMSVTVSGPPRP